MMDPACSLPSHREFESGYGPGSADMRRGWGEYLPEGPAGIDSRDERISPLFTENLAGLPSAFVLTGSMIACAMRGKTTRGGSNRQASP